MNYFHDICDIMFVMWTYSSLIICSYDYIYLYLFICIFIYL